MTLGNVIDAFDAAIVGPDEFDVNAAGKQQRSVGAELKAKILPEFRSGPLPRNAS
jgi:hypothetical protein